MVNVMSIAGTFMRRISILIQAITFLHLDEKGVLFIHSKCALNTLNSNLLRKRLLLGLASFSRMVSFSSGSWHSSPPSAGNATVELKTFFHLPSSFISPGITPLELDGLVCCITFKMIGVGYFDHMPFFLQGHPRVLLTVFLF